MDAATRRRSFASDGDGYGDEDDEQNERDEDDTARLSDDRRKPNTDGNQRSVQRVKSLTERNRQVSIVGTFFCFVRDSRARHRHMTLASAVLVHWIVFALGDFAGCTFLHSGQTSCLKQSCGPITTLP